MDLEIYSRMEEIEEMHWWFTSRRAIIAEVLGRMLKLKSSAYILEAGCGTGGNLTMLEKYGVVDAFEPQEYARRVASRKTRANIAFGALPNDIPFGDMKYDLVALFDVLEHVEQDIDSLIALGEYLNDEGAILLTVPAFPVFWSRHDHTHHHYRRYTRSTLQSAVEHAGLRLEKSFYFNTLLLPLAVTIRIIKAAIKSETPDEKLPAGWLNSLLGTIFSSERLLIGRVQMPLGLSLGAIIRK